MSLPGLMADVHQLKEYVNLHWGDLSEFLCFMKKFLCKEKFIRYLI